MEKIKNLVLLVVALIAFGCGSASTTALDDDANQTTDADAKSTGADVSTTNNADVAAQQGADTGATKADAQNAADATQNADVAQKVDAGADSGVFKVDVFHNDTNDAGADSNVATDTGSSKDTTADSGSKDTGSSADIQVGVDASKGTDSVDAGADITPTCVATFELCDGKDNDCDGYTDEDFGLLGANCQIGIGECAVSDSINVCTQDGKGTTCSKPAKLPTAELCDGKDNDCDGLTDEDFVLGTACGNGVCANVWICSADKLGTVCPGISNSVPEVCGDSLDNNCDGVVDDGCPVCDAIQCALIGGACNANGVCVSYCDSCTSGQNCNDTNQDGLGDTCETLTYPETFGGESLAIRFTEMPVNSSWGIMGHIQMYDEQNPIGTKWTDGSYQENIWWDIYPFSTTGAFTFYQTGNNPKGFYDETACGMRFNADIDSNYWDKLPASAWLCEGNGPSAHLTKGAKIYRYHNGVFIELTLNKQFKLYSPPGGPSAGCAPYIPLNSNCPQP